MRKGVKKGQMYKNRHLSKNYKERILIQKVKIKSYAAKMEK